MGKEINASRIEPMSKGIVNYATSMAKANKMSFAEVIAAMSVADHALKMHIILNAHGDSTTQSPRTSQSEIPNGRVKKLRGAAAWPEEKRRAVIEKMRKRLAEMMANGDIVYANGRRCNIAKLREQAQRKV